VIRRDLRILLWDILQYALEVKIPFLGIPIKGVNNPIFVIDGIIYNSHNKSLVKINTFSEFVEQFNEAIGFNCAKANEYWDTSFPFSSYYIYVTNEIAEKAINECNIPIDRKEKFDVLHLIDEALFPSNYIIKALRTAQELDSSILYREGEEPVKIMNKPFKIRTILSFPIDYRVKYIDNSIIHLVGIIPIEYVESNSIELIEIENGLWSALYSLPYPSVKNWKWIGDVNWVTLIEFLKSEEA